MKPTTILPPYERRPFTFDRVVRIIIVTLILCGLVWLLRRLSSVLMPFMVAWLIAYLLEPFVQRNRQMLKLKGRFVAIVVTLFEVVMLIVVLCVVFLPSVFSEMNQVGELIREYAADSSKVPLIPPTVREFIATHVDFNKIYEGMTSQDWRSVADYTGRFISGGFDIILGIVNWFLVVLYVIFIMIDYEKLLQGFKHMVPPRMRKTTFAVANDVKDSMNHYFRGQSLVALCVGILFSIGFLIVGLPLGVVLGLFIGLLNMVPYLQLISIIPTTLMCLVYSVQDGVGFWPIWWSCMAVYVIVQCIQDLFLTPKIMGKAMGLNPAIILLSLSVWGSLMGFIGLIIALPLTTLLLSYYNQFIINRNDGETPSQRHGDSHAFEQMIQTPLDDE